MTARPRIVAAVARLDAPLKPQRPLPRRRLAAAWHRETTAKDSAQKGKP
jgi:hypothetical protein